MEFMLGAIFALHFGFNTYFCEGNWCVCKRAGLQRNCYWQHAYCVSRATLEKTRQAGQVLEASKKAKFKEKIEKRTQRELYKSFYRTEREQQRAEKEQIETCVQSLKVATRDTYFAETAVPCAKLILLRQLFCAAMLRVSCDHPKQLVLSCKDSHFCFTTHYTALLCHSEENSRYLALLLCYFTVEKCILEEDV